jgi:hypothetical protein
LATPSRNDAIRSGAGTDRLQQVLLRARRRQHDDLALRRSLAQARQRREPVDPGHREIEQNEVGLQPPRFDDGFGPVGGDADDLEAVRMEQRREGLAGQRVVVDDQDGSQLLTPIGSRPPADK